MWEKKSAFITFPMAYERENIICQYIAMFVRIAGKSLTYFLELEERKKNLFVKSEEAKT